MTAPAKAARAPLDWAEIRRRMDEVGRAIAGQSELSPEQRQRILAERAAVLARPPIAPASGEQLELVTFSLQSEVWAIETRYVLEVFRMAHLALLPGAEPPVIGVTAWRGDLLTVLQLGGTVAGAPSEDAGGGRVLVLGARTAAFGIVADAVHEVVRLAAIAVQPLPDGLAAKATFLRGITPEAALVLDAESLLHSH